MYGDPNHVLFVFTRIAWVNPETMLEQGDSGSAVAKNIYSLLRQSPRIEREWILQQIFSDLYSDKAAVKELPRFAGDDKLEECITAVYQRH